MPHRFFSGCSEWGSSPVSVRWLPVVASLWEHRLSGAGSSVVAGPRLSGTGSIDNSGTPLGCPTACGIFPDRGLSRRPLHLAGGLFTTEPPRKPNLLPFLMIRNSSDYIEIYLKVLKGYYTKHFEDN